MLKTPWRECVIVAGLAAASLGLRVVVAAVTGVFQDEALYWWLARDAAVSFSPQPPGVALLVRWGEALLGVGTLGLRAGSLLSGTAGVVLAAVLGWEFYGRRAAVWAGALSAACPLLVGAGAVMTPDATVVCLWLLFVWTTWRAAQSDRLGWWAASGAVLAAGGYTKYMMALAVPCAFVALCASRRGRRLLRGPGPWGAAGLGAALFVPVFLAWNARHGWASLRYHLVARHVWMFQWSLVGKYVGIHLGALSPVLWIGVLASFVALWRAWRRDGCERGAWLLGFGLVPILVFAPPSLFTEQRMVRVHWDLIGYAVGIVALAGLIAGRDEDGGSKRLALGIGALATAAVVTVGLFASAVWPGLTGLVGARPLTVRMLGWRELAARVRELEKGLREPHFVLTNSFKSALCLGFERRSRDGIYTLRSRYDAQYGLTEQLAAWGIDEASFLEERRGEEALYVHEFTHPEAPRAEDQPLRVLRFFGHLEPQGEVTVVGGGTTMRRFGLYRARQMIPRKPTRSPDPD